MQSNFGIVTKMGVWLFPEPEVFVSCRAILEREDDLGPLIETLRPFVLDRTIPNVPLIGNELGAGMWGKTRRDGFDGEGPLPRGVLERIGRECGAGFWSVRFALYGREALVDAQLELVRAAFSRIAGSRLLAKRMAGWEVSERAEDLADRAQSGIPSLDMLQMLGWWGGVGETSRPSRRSAARTARRSFGFCVRSSRAPASTTGRRSSSRRARSSTSAP